jgi:hypothetical protein
MKYSGITINTNDLTLGDTQWFRKNEKKLGANRRAWPYWSNDIRPLAPVITAPPPTKGLSSIKFAWATAPNLRIIHNNLLERFRQVGFDDCFWTGGIILKGAAIDWSYCIPRPEARIPFPASKIPSGQAFEKPFGVALGVSMVLRTDFLPLLKGFRDPELETVSLPNLRSDGD